MMHGVTGRTHLRIAGVDRILVADMNAAAVFCEQRGEAYQEWLAARFLGNRTVLEDGSVKVEFAPITSKERIETLYALLASDREDRRLVDETVFSLGKSFALVDEVPVWAALMGAVMAGFKVPGEEIEAVISAAAGPRESAAAHGTGTTPWLSLSES